MSWVVRIERVAHQPGIAGLPPIGTVKWSREYVELSDALREANAWSGTGEFAHYAPSDFRGEVVDSAFVGNSGVA